MFIQDITKWKLHNMPIISEFYGIKIYLYVDHLPPHIHIHYNNLKFRFNIRDGVFINADKPPKTLRKLVFKWYNLNKTEILEAWD
jgi:hypothetical protein